MRLEIPGEIVVALVTGDFFVVRLSPVKQNIDDSFAFVPL
jgi:hypothetical protein